MSNAPTYDALLAAVEANFAWNYAERADGAAGTTFNERMDLASYAEWLAYKAMGFPAGPHYQGIPHLGIGDGFEILRAKEAEVQQMVARVLAVAKQKQEKP